MDSLKIFNSPSKHLNPHRGRKRTNFDLNKSLPAKLFDHYNAILKSKL